MDILSQHDRRFIADYPLGSSFDHLYDSLYDVVQFYGQAGSAYDGGAGNSRQDHQMSISRLLSALMGRDSS
jgi:hypothetical protein